MEGVANGDMAMQIYTCSNCTLINPISNEKCSACECIRPQNNNYNNNVHMSSRLSLPSPSISVNIKNEEQPLAPFAPYQENQENKNQDKFPRPKKQRKCKCLLPIPDCDCECDCRNCLCLSECTKFSYPWSTFLGVVVTSLYLVAWATPWLIGPEVDQVPCYSIGALGELCDPETLFTTIPPSFYTSGVCCPQNVGCCAFNPNVSIEMFGESHHNTYPSSILLLTIPVWFLSILSHHFTIWSCSSRKNISCWWCCCCCHNNACNVDCCQISETTFTCCDAIQFLTILIRLTTILLTFSTLIMFETNDSVKQLKTYSYPFPTSPEVSSWHVGQPGMIVASIALCFDFLAGLLLSADFWGRKKSKL